MDTGETASPEAASVAVRRLSPKGEEAVLAQLLGLEKRLFKKADAWGDLLIKETQRSNAFLLYAAAPAPAEAPAAAAAAPQQPPQRKPAGKRAAAQQGQQLSTQQKGSTQQLVVGYIVFTATGLNAHISKLAVAPEWRRRGIARRLVQEVVHTARHERRVASLSLHVDADNTPALALYQGEGFESEALLEDYYARGRHAHKMRLELDSSL